MIKIFQAKRRNLVINSLAERKPMQTLKERGDMIKFGTEEGKSSWVVLNFLEFFNEVFWRTSEQRITVI